MKPQCAMHLLFLAAIIAIPAVFLSPGGEWFLVSDLPEYYAAGHMLACGSGADIYKTEALRACEQALFPQLGQRSIDFFLPPVLLALFIPLSFVPTGIVLYIWTAVLVLVILASLVLMEATFGLSRRQTLWLSVVMSLSGPVWECLRTGQIAPFLLLGLTCAIKLSGDRGSLQSGLAQGLWLVKPHLLLPVVLAQICLRQWRTLAGTAALLAGGLALSYLLIGGRGFVNYVELVGSHFMQSQSMRSSVGPTLRGQLLACGVAPAVAADLSWAGLALFLVLVAWLAFRRADGRQAVIACFALTVPGALLFAHHMHNYDLVVMLPALLCVKRAGLLAGLPVRLVVAGLLPLLVLVMPAYNFLHYYWVLQGGVPNPFFILLAYIEVVVVCLIWRETRRTS